MLTYYYEQNHGKLRMQSHENGQKPQFWQFLDDFEVKYLQIAHFFWKIGLIKIEGFWEFWANLETFLRISPNQEFFSKIQLCHFSIFIVP